MHMSAAIVKGLIEHDDGTRFFGSTTGYASHLDKAILRGLVSGSGAVTSIGIEWYERCLKQLPQTRQAFWNKDAVGQPAHQPTDEEKKAALRFLECCEDPHAGGHDVPKPMMKRLAELGLVAHKGGGWYEGTAELDKLQTESQGSN